MSYVDVPAETILAFLKGHGFTERTDQRGTEIVYQRAHKVDSRYKVLIYTSVRRGAKSARVRGKDAIRVCAIFEDANSSRGICKLPRVYRTGTVEDVLARMIGRAREAYARCCKLRPKAAQCPGPIVLSNLPEPARTSLTQVFDAVLAKHHPGARDPSAEVNFLDGGRPDDEIDEP